MKQVTAINLLDTIKKNPAIQNFLGTGLRALRMYFLMTLNWKMLIAINLIIMWGKEIKLIAHQDSKDEIVRMAKMSNMLERAGHYKESEEIDGYLYKYSSQENQRYEDHIKHK